MTIPTLSAEDLALVSAHLTPAELAQLDALITSPEQERARYRDDPESFVRNVLGVSDPAPYQIRILHAIRKYRRVCVRSLHGAGKTTTAAWIVLWFATTHEECKVPTTASAWRQLTEFLWPEIHKWALKADWSKIGLKVRMGRELLGQKLQVSPTAGAFALSSTDEAKIEGAHSEAILYLFDEAKTIPAEIWDAAEGALSTENSYAVALSTPGDSNGRFYEIQSKKTGYEDWHVIHISLEECIAAGRVTREWAEQRRKAWGEDSALFRRRVLGEFAEDEAETVIRLSAVERANERWHAMHQRVSELVEKGGHTPEEADLIVWGPLTHVGCDPARLGRDRTGFAFRHSTAIKRLDRTSKEELMPTAGRLVAATRDNDAIIQMDAIGLGAGVYDRLRELWRLKEWRGNEMSAPVKAINAGLLTKMTDRTGQLRFKRVRDWLYWNMREMLEQNEIALPPDPELTEDLVVAQYSITSDGFIVVETKDDLRERLPGHRSPDTGEAVMLAFFPEQPPYKPLLAVF